FRICGKHRNVFVPSVGKLAALHFVKMVGELRIFLPVLIELLTPAQSSFASASPDSGPEMVPHAVGHEKLRLFRPSVVALCQFDFGLAQRLAVSSTRILLVRSSVADVAVDDAP